MFFSFLPVWFGLRFLRPRAAAILVRVSVVWGPATHARTDRPNEGDLLPTYVAVFSTVIRLLCTIT